MKRFTLAIISIMMWVGINAAPDNFTVKAPTWTKVVWSIGDDTKIYKTPSDHAPRLVYNWAKMRRWDPLTTAKWTTARLTDEEDYLTLSLIPKPVISEKNGWYEIPDVNYDDTKSENGWVKASSCSCAAPEPVYAGRYNRDNFQWVDSPGDPAGGNYAMFVEHDPRGGGAIYVGREIGRVVVCPYVLDYTFRSTEDGENTIFEFDEYELNLNGDQVGVDNNPILSKIPYDVKKILFSKAKKTTTPIVVFACGMKYYSTTAF